MSVKSSNIYLAFKVNQKYNKQKIDLKKLKKNETMKAIRLEERKILYTKHPQRVNTIHCYQNRYFHHNKKQVQHTSLFLTSICKDTRENI